MLRSPQLQSRSWAQEGGVLATVNPLACSALTGPESLPPPPQQGLMPMRADKNEMHSLLLSFATALPSLSQGTHCWVERHLHFPTPSGRKHLSRGPASTPSLAT